MVIPFPSMDVPRRRLSVVSGSHREWGREVRIHTPDAMPCHHAVVSYCSAGVQHDCRSVDRERAHSSLARDRDGYGSSVPCVPTCCGCTCTHVFFGKTPTEGESVTVKLLTTKERNSLVPGLSMEIHGVSWWTAIKSNIQRGARVIRPHLTVELVVHQL